MSDDQRQPSLHTSVLYSAQEVVADVRDRRPESIALFGDLTDFQREQLAQDAWSIGLRALGYAHTAAQESKLTDIGATLLSDIDRQLRTYIDHQQATIAAVLGRYFDPRDGQVSQRLEAFVADQGVLARLLDRYLGPTNSVLAEALARQIGDSSPLLKKLSPTESDGIVKSLERQLNSALVENRADLVRALDPLADDGAVARFLRSLRDELKGADEDRAKQLTSALAALDANDEHSLISRLARETHQARQDVLSAVNPDAPNSPMAILKTSLTTLLERQAADQAEVARQQEARQVLFEKEVREALARIETRRSLDQRSVRGGLDFEDSVVAFVRAATHGAPCVFDVTSTTAGIGRCKKGDAVLRFTEESAFAGVAVVFEAKRDASYTAQKALAELDAARKNRDAAAGVFVMARSHADDVFPRFARYGSNVLVTWDDEDPGSDAYLHAAIVLGMALVMRVHTVGGAGDIAALRDIESRIEAELSRLEKIEKYSDSIRKNADGIGEEVRKAQKALNVLLRNAQSTLHALNVELHDESRERETPITLAHDSLAEATLALSSGGEAA